MQDGDQRSDAGTAFGLVGATASAWLERKTGKHLQGKEKQGVFDTYLRADMKERLNSVPAPKPIGYQAEGQFFL